MNTTMTSVSASAGPTNRWGRIALRALQILAAAAFLTAGCFKLAGNEMTVQVFDQIGIGQWFRYVTGIVEIVGAVALLVPFTAAFGAALLAITMLCAVGTYLFIIGGNPVPAIILLLITASVAWIRRGSFAPYSDKQASGASHSFGPARNRDHAGARDFDQAERQHQIHEAVDLVGRAGDLEHEALGTGVDDAGAERIGKPQRLDPMLALAAHLDHGELALQRRAAAGQIDDAMHRHQPVELILDLLDHHRRTAGDDGDARKVLLVLGLRDGE